MDKEKLLALIAKKTRAKDEVRGKIEASEDVKELKELQVQFNDLTEEIRGLQEILDSIPDEPPAAAPAAAEPPKVPLADPDGRTAAVNGEIPGIVVSNAKAQQVRATDDPLDKFSTVEYRTAFMDYCKTGRMSAEFKEIQPDMRADAMTSVSDVSAVVPTTILNEVIRKIKEYGQIYARVRKLSVKGGVTIPILSLEPTATWIGESATSVKKRAQANTNITFSYYGLECKVSTSLLADTVTLAGFENTITELVVKAMVVAMDTAIVKGNGTGQPLGITKDTRVPAAQKVTLSTSEFGEWDTWKKKVFARMPLKYKAGASFFMASGTFEGYVDGMVDANGQPIGRINYGITNGPQERFGGKEVVLVEDDIIANYDDAATGDVVAIYGNLMNYGFNSNLQMLTYRYFDHDTNEWIDKMILIADGKLIDPYGFVIVIKGA